MKKIFSVLLILLSFLLLGVLTSCKGGEETTAPTDTDETTPQETQDSGTAETTVANDDWTFLFEGEYESVLPKPQTPETVYVFSLPATEDDMLALVSAQGLLAKSSSEQIFVNYDSSSTAFYGIMKTTYSGVTNVIQSGAMWSFIRKHAESFDGYILTDLGDESINVATSLAGILNALIVTPTNENMAQNCSLSCLIDVSGKDDAWLRESEYFDRLNKDVAFMLTPTGVPFLRDYAIFCDAYMFADTDTSINALKSKVNFLNDNFVVLGWNNNLGEKGTVDAISAMNGSLIPADWAKNLALLAALPMNEAKQSTDVTYSNGENKHTVCLVMSDGDNLQWTTNDMLTSTKWFSSSQRGKFPLGWGVPATMIDVAPPALAYYYTKMSPNDEFIMQLSGTGYTFPSQWKNANALKAMQQDVASLMERSDISVMEILDSVTLTNSVVDRFYSGFMEYDSIDGILYIDYGNYAAYEGEIFWSEGKPLVTARYRLWADVSGTADVAGIAEAINSASTDPTSADSYSFIIIHAWSGLDTSGNLVNGGNTMDAVAALVEAFGDTVELVTPTEFIHRISENVSH